MATGQPLVTVGISLYLRDGVAIAGGRLKTRPADFRVTEVALCGRAASMDPHESPASSTVSASTDTSDSASAAAVLEKEQVALK